MDLFVSVKPLHCRFFPELKIYIYILYQSGFIGDTEIVLCVCVFVCPATDAVQVFRILAKCPTVTLK